MNKERTQAEISEICERACEILKKTKDGDLLDPSDLKLTEHAVNGFLNETGYDAFNKLYQRVVVDETYIKPFLHNLEHLTRDHMGYIYYKGIQVEHYDRDYIYSDDAKNQLTELKRRCEFLERKGVEVSWSSVIWGWDSHADEYSAERVKKLDALIGANALYYSRVEIYNSGRQYSYFYCGHISDLAEIKDHPVTKSMTGRYFDDEYQIKVELFGYEKAPRKNIILPSDIKRPKIESILPSCHDYLKKYGKLEVLPIVSYKTDFAEGYENAVKLDLMLNESNKSDRSLQYSEVFMCGSGSEQKKLYIIGIPTFDEVKATFEYQYMREIYENDLNVSMTSYQYGEGEPLTADEIPRADDVAELLYEAHDYLDKHDLSEEICWNDYTRGLRVSRQRNSDYQTEPNDEIEDGYEI